MARILAVIAGTLLLMALDPAPHQGLRIWTPAFHDNGFMPAKTAYDKAGCSGANASPKLQWSGVPPGTRSMALIVHDPDAPAPGGWYHWIAYNLSPAVRGLRERAALRTDQLGMTSFHTTGYGGPCPPPGKPHHYHFVLYALDVPRMNGTLTGPQLLAGMRGHIMGIAETIGLYRR